jgi:Zn-dependent protease with chaperone function
MWFAQDAVTTYTYTTTTTDTAGAGIFAGAMVVWLLLMLALVVVQIIAMWKIFVKAGVEGWKSIIPFYNYWVLCEIVGKPGWWGLTPILMAIPIVNFIAWIPVVILFVIIALELGKAFGKDTVWSIFLLIIFSLIGLLILGFGSDKYQGPLVAKTPEAPAPQA